MTARTLLRTTPALSIASVATICLVGAGLASAGAPRDRDSSLQQRLIGSWTTKSFGTQELTNYSNGTARLDVTLSRLAALRYGKSLTLDLVWKVKNGVMTHTVKGGNPPEKVARLVNDWGKTLKYEIVELTDSHMLLVEPNDDDPTRWDAKTEVAARN